MPNVVRVDFRRHGRASKGSGRSISANRSRVAPPFRPTSEVEIDSHHSAGILSLCDHLRTAVAGAPISEAIASQDGHKSTTARKDVSLDMRGVLGQSVLSVKPNMSCDASTRAGIICPMADGQTATEYRLGFVRRVRWARISRGYSQEDIANLLNIKQNKYKHYEGGRLTLMPHQLIGKFCLACDIDEKWLFTGKGKAPTQQEPPPEKPKRARAAKKKLKAA